MRWDAASETGLLTPRRVILQLVGFAVGLGLLYWCIRGAVEKGDWQAIREADPSLVAVLVGCTALSLLINGATFWITIRPIKPLAFWDLQRVNLVGNLLNYAPIRLGAIARVAYHMRVDRLRLLQIGAWFAFIGYVLILSIAACLVATLLHTGFDGIWILLVLGQMLVGSLACRIFMVGRLVERYGHGLDDIIRDPAALWGATALRIGDLVAFGGRMCAAVAILDLHVPMTHVAILAVVAIGASMTPFGRVGIREWSVAQAAALLSMSTEDITGSLQQLALLESAGEALVYVPAGALTLLWYRKRWVRASAGA